MIPSVPIPSDVLLVPAAVLAGILTVLAPCIAPVVVLVMGSAATGGRRRSAGIIVGFATTFLAVTILFAAILAAAGITTGPLRLASAILLGLVGLSIMLPGLGAWLGGRLRPVADVGVGLAATTGSDGFGGGLVIGAAIGLIWAPCVGPIMAGVIAAAAVGGPSLDGLLIAAGYVLGVAVPLAIVARWGSAIGASATRIGRGGRRALGGLMVVLAVLVLAGQDLAVENELTAFGASVPAVADAADDPATAAASGTGLPDPVATTLPGPVTLDDLGPAPDFTGITAWINSQPVTMAALRGRPVLVEFWTFACINCIHVQPYVKAWAEQYAGAGLVVIGVHTPELSFERELGNVRDAVAKAGLTYPVAFDPSFSTWNAYHNRFWPAMYFIDKQGHVRHTQFGEGGYDTSEQVIRQLLQAQG